MNLIALLTREFSYLPVSSDTRGQLDSPDTRLLFNPVSISNCFCRLTWRTFFRTFHALETHKFTSNSSRPCSSPEDAQTLRDLVGQYVSHPNQLNYDSRAFVSTFAGESCLFGQGSTVDGWKTQFAQHPEVQGKIYFVPAFFIDPAKFGDFRGVMDGDFNVSLTLSFSPSKP